MPASWTYQFSPGETNFSDFRLAANPPAGVGGKLYLLSAVGGSTGPNWLVGSYTDLKSVATNLRGSRAHQQFAAVNDLLFGFRKADLAPSGQRQKSFGDPVPGADANRSNLDARVQPLLRSVHGGIDPKNRVTDRWENVRTYWSQRTVEAHHIVEFSNLETIGKSKRKGTTLLDRNQLPCVLLMAEFHQCYVSSVLKHTHAWDAPRLLAGLADVYHDIYTRRSMGPSGSLRLDALWDVSRAILKTAGVSAKPRA